ncbi:MAG TPA: hypothetical protein VNN22_14315 [Verrucomicrobiae bacterium]|nr:hypothetical protein [Verrucomicrobiae bacterium]
MKTFIILVLSCASLFAGETFVTLKSGETNGVSYGLSTIVSDSWSATHMPPSDDFADLFLTLRNDSAKSMSFGDITVEDFSVRDAEGQVMTIYLRTSPQDVKGIHNGRATVIHLEVALPHALKSPQPWMFHFKAKPDFGQSLDLTISGIKIRRH